MKLRLQPYRLDIFYIALLLLLNLFFFWRLITPVEADRLIIDSRWDFALQYYNFSGYQAERFAEGTLIPLWNPNNFGGNVFLGDPQSAAAYPLRWLTLALFGDNWSYLALELELMLHYALASLLMYGFMRRLTGWPIGGMVGALAFAYGAYLHSFPVQQVTILEAATWLPLTMWGIYEGSGGRGWRGIVLAGLGMGMTFLAGHPQLALLCGYFAFAYLGFRSYSARYSWKHWLAKSALFIVVAFGVGAVALLPAFEFQALTTRADDLSYADKTIGFIFENSFLALWTTPGFANYWYIGPVLVVLGLLAFYFQRAQTWFWLGSGTIAFLIGYGGKTAIVQLLYVLLPGFALFRNPERSLIIWAFSAAVLAGFGAVSLLRHLREAERPLFYRLLAAGGALMGLYFLYLYPQTEGPFASLNKEIAGYTLVLSLLAAGVFALLARPQTSYRQALLLGLLLFDLFSVSQGHEFNYLPGNPASTLSPDKPPGWVPELRSLLAEDPLAKIDSTDKLGPYSTLYSLPDLQGGISPLRFSTVSELLRLPEAKKWHLFGVRYVVSSAETLPLPSEVLRQYPEGEASLYLHALQDVRPLASFYYHADIVADTDAALAALQAENYPYRERLLLTRFPPLPLPEATPERPPQVEAQQVAAEHLELSIETAANGLLLLGIPQHPGWQAQLDGRRVELLQANAGLMAVPIESGSHTLSLRFNPLSFRLGALLSLLSWAGILLSLLSVFWQRRNHELTF